MMLCDVVLQKKTLSKLSSNSNETFSAPTSNFAQKHLEKLGWRQGDGLGKRRDGISTHLRTVVKDDVKGIGAKEAEYQQASKEWWSAGFDAALSKIKVPNDSLSAAPSSSLDDSRESSDDSSEDDDLDFDEDAKISIQARDLSQYSEQDQKLFLACGGRRCGKRAGRLQTGKILREQKADAMFRRAAEKLASQEGENNAKEKFHIAARESMKSNDNFSNSIVKATDSKKEAKTKKRKAKVGANSENDVNKLSSKKAKKLKKKEKLKKQEKSKKKTKRHVE